MSIKPALSLTRHAKLIFWMFSPNLKSSEELKLKVCFVFITNHSTHCEAVRSEARQMPRTNPQKKWWSLTESNRRHPACKAGALPAELRPLFCN